MTDIVDRLRAMQGMGDIQLKALMDGVGPQAAEEIERLQGVIAGLRKDFEAAHARMMTSAAAEREACAAICDELESFWSAEKDVALLNGDVALSNASSGEPRAARAIAQAIRARGTA